MSQAARTVPRRRWAALRDTGASSDTGCRVQVMDGRHLRPVSQPLDGERATFMNRELPVEEAFLRRSASASSMLDALALITSMHAGDVRAAEAILGEAIDGAEPIATLAALARWCAFLGAKAAQTSVVGPDVLLEAIGSMLARVAEAEVRRAAH